MRRAWSALAIVLLAASAKADEGVLLRYKWVEGQQFSWATSTVESGTTTVTGTEGRRIQGGTTKVSKTVYVRVDKVTPEGLADLHISFGLVITDQDDGKGNKSHTEMNPLDGAMAVGDGPNRTTVKRTLGAGELYLKGFTAVVDDRGQVREVRDNEALAKLLAGRADAAELLKRAAATGLAALPLLPEKAVKPGDEWQVDTLSTRGGLMEYAPGNEPVMATLRYEGDEKVGEVACRRISLHSAGADIDLDTPAAVNDGLEAETHLSKFRISGDFYLSVEDGLVRQAKTSSALGLTVHVYGTQTSPGGETKVDVTATSGNHLKVEEIKRQ